MWSRHDICETVDAWLIELPTHGNAFREHWLSIFVDCTGQITLDLADVVFPPHASFVRLWSIGPPGNKSILFD
jgi:hypothetical protein